MAPHASVIDITHDVPAHDVRAGGLALVRAVQYLAPGVVLAVVDPGVGGDRRAVAVEVAGGEAIFVGPDNGLLAPAVSMVGGASRAVELTSVEHRLPAPGPTFAARDIFSPAVAHICNGGDLGDLGPDVDPYSLRPGLLPVARMEDGKLLAEVLWVDRFGNAQLNVDPDEIGQMGGRVLLQYRDESRVAVRSKTYDELGPGQVGLVVDSYGLVSVAVSRASAADLLRIQAGDAVVLAEPS
jgi:S-adenosylmethionine hydrolase